MLGKDIFAVVTSLNEFVDTISRKYGAHVNVVSMLKHTILRGGIIHLKILLTASRKNIK